MVSFPFYYLSIKFAHHCAREEITERQSCGKPREQLFFLFLLPGLILSVSNMLSNLRYLFDFFDFIHENENESSQLRISSHMFFARFAIYLDALRA